MRRSRFLGAGFLAVLAGWLIYGDGLWAQKDEPGPTAFRTREGKTGWKLVLPGGRPLATPAVADGKIFLGGGFGSHEFYALDAKTGKQAWLYRTGDDGPTAAVVENGLVAFSTESCELHVMTTDGKLLWKKWLGDPLLSMPALHDGMVFAAYPDSKGDGKHRLACFDARTGKELWKQPIEAAVITAPVVHKSRVVVATLDGTLASFDVKTGQLAWKEMRQVTSSPTVWQSRCYCGMRDGVGTNPHKGAQQIERVASRTTANTADWTTLDATRQNADYLDFEKRQKHSSHEKKLCALDTAVGFTAAHVSKQEPPPAEGEEENRAVSELLKLTAKEKHAPGAGQFGASGATAKVVAPKTPLPPPPFPAAITNNFGSYGGFPPSMGNFGHPPGYGAFGGTQFGGFSGMHAVGQFGSGVGTFGMFGMTGNPFARPPAQFGQFGSLSPTSAAPTRAGVYGQFGMGTVNTGQMSVSGVWSYQGSRPFVSGGRLYVSMGDTLKCVNLDGGKLVWTRRLGAVKEKPIDDPRLKHFGAAVDAALAPITRERLVVDATLTPPVLVNGKVFVGSAQGVLYCFKAGTGALLWQATVGEAIQFQPAVVQGRVYVGTAQGSLVCLETGDARDDGWAMWGADPGHNGVLKEQ